MLSDPIVALATPPGRAALAVIRLSGAGIFDVARQVILGFRTEPARNARLATFVGADQQPIDRGLYTVFPAPNSYTGDDLVELSCHGGLQVPARLLASLHAAGARPEEDDGPISPEQISDRIDAVAAQIKHLVATAPAAERLREGALLVFAGRPNAGKSSLFNALLGTARTLVTEIPGTTRDAVEAHTDFLGWPVRLVDTAGLWEAPAEIDRMGVEVSRRYMASADLVLLCAEAGRRLGEDESAIISERPTLVVRTKTDLAEAGRDELGVSTVTGDGLAELRQRAAGQVFGRQI